MSRFHNLEGNRPNPSEKAFRLFLAKSLHHKNEETSYLESIKILWSYIKEDDFPYEAWHYLGLNYGKLKKHDFHPMH